MTADDEQPAARPAETGVALYRPVPRRLPLFAWGRLQDPRFVGHLLGHPVDTAQATLHDVAAVDLDDSGEPLLVASPGAMVEGLLLESLLPADYDALDAYSGVEEGLYHRQIGQITRDEGDERREAYVYLASDKALAQFT